MAGSLLPAVMPSKRTQDRLEHVRKYAKPAAEEAVSTTRTTVILAKVIQGMAEQMMKERGFNNNFSAYIADLIRRDKEDLERKSKKPIDT